MLRFSQGRPPSRATDPAPGTVRANFDPMSGVAQRELFLLRAQQQWSDCAQAHRPLALLLIRFDGIGGRDEMLDHEAHTEALRCVAEAIAEHCVRRADFAGRLRQCELGVILSEVTFDGAMEMAEAIRVSVEARRAPHPSQRTHLTVSIGVACMVPQPHHFVAEMLVVADHALREAQSEGGNCVVAGDDQGL